MNAWLLVTFFAGAVGHKCWRAGWRAWTHKVTVTHALVDEFMPPSPERDEMPRKRRPLRETEIA